MALGFASETRVVRSAKRPLEVRGGVIRYARRDDPRSNRISAPLVAKYAVLRSKH